MLCAVGNNGKVVCSGDGGKSWVVQPTPVTAHLQAIAAWNEQRAVMRRTQTFNCILQEGLLLSFVERTGVLLPKVEHKRCTRKGAEFCEYEVTWLPRT